MKFLFVVVLLVCTNLLFSQRGNATRKGNARGRSKQVGGGFAKTAQQSHRGILRPVAQFSNQGQRTNRQPAPQPFKTNQGNRGIPQTGPQQVGKFLKVAPQVPMGLAETAAQQVGQALAKPAPQNAIKPSAHLEPLDLRFTTYEAKQEIRDWSVDSPSSHLEGMTYSNGELTVPTSGRYYIYTQIYFRARTNKPSILVTVNDHTVTMLLPMVGHEGNMFTAGVFKLNKDDVVMLKVGWSGLTTVYMSPGYCYFGAYMI